MVKALLRPVIAGGGDGVLTSERAVVLETETAIAGDRVVREDGR